MDSLETTPELEKYRLNVENRDGHTYQFIRDPTTGLVTRQVWKRRRHLGSGGFGDVWQEGREDEYEDWHYRAVKVCSMPKMKANKIDYMKELSTLAAFSFSKSSDLFVNLHGWWTDSGNIFFAMEHLRFGDLSKYATSNISEAEVKEIADNILRGLEVMHRRGYAHRDIKPENILVVEKRPEFSRWRVKIADFGISKQVLEGSGTALRTIVGTTGYCAPEVLGYFERQESSIYTTKVDMWSLGCVIFNVSSQGHVPFSPPDLGRYCDDKIALNSKDLPICLDTDGISFIKALLQARPEARPTATEALQHSWLKTLYHVAPRNSSTASSKSDSTKRDNYNTFLRSSYLTDLPLNLTQRSSTTRTPTVLVTEGASETTTVAQRLPDVIYSGDEERPFGRSFAINPFPPETFKHESRSETTGTSYPDEAVLGGSFGEGMFQQNELAINTKALRHSAVSDITQGVPQNEQSRLAGWLEKNKIKIQEIGKTGGTPLHLAAGQGQVKIARSLRDRGIEIRSKNVDGWTPLHFAAWEGRLEMAKWLVEQGIHIGVKSNNGWTSLHYAAWKGHLKTAKWLVEQGADVDLKNDNGSTALHFAAQQGQLDMAKWLVGQGADVSVKNNNGWTALHFAAWEGRLEMAKWLVEQGADVGVKNNNGRTPPYFATQQGQLELARWLREQRSVTVRLTQWKKKLFGDK